MWMCVYMYINVCVCLTQYIIFPSTIFRMQGFTVPATPFSPERCQGSLTDADSAQPPAIFRCSCIMYEAREPHQSCPQWQHVTLELWCQARLYLYWQSCVMKELSQFRCLFSIFMRTAKFSIRSLLCTSQGKWFLSGGVAPYGRQAGHATESLRKQGNGPLLCYRTHRRVWKTAHVSSPVKSLNINSKE